MDRYDPKKDNNLNKYEPSGKEEEMRTYVYDRKKAMEDSPHRKRAEIWWKKGREMWEALRTERDRDDWQSNHYVPLAASIIETEISEMVDQSAQPLILPRGPEDVPKSSVMSNIFTYTWEVADSDLESHDVLKDALTCGTGIGQEFYWRDARKIHTSKKSNGDYNEDDAYDYDDCYLEAVPLEDFLVDEKARSFTGPYGARDCIRRYVMDIDDFRLFFQGKVWDPLNNAKYVSPGGDTYLPSGYNLPESINKDRDVEVLWYWSKKPEDWLIIVAHGVVVVMGPNPYKHKQLPFARAVDIRRTHHFYGKGEPELLESIQDEQNTLRRMIIDRNHLDIDKMFFVSSRLNLSDEDLVARPHGMIPTEDPQDAKAVEYNDIPRSVELSLKHLEDDGTVVTGVNPRAQALPTTGTATEAAILKESTLKRIKLKLMFFEKEFLTTVARLRVSNIIQYYSQPKLEKIVGDERTAQYRKHVDELKAKGLLVTMDGQKYRKTYKNIRMKDKQLTVSPATGSPVIKPTKGYTFFEATPDTYMPSARGGYDIRFAAGPTLPVSKPLLQTKTTELYDRLIQLALAGVGYDPIKLGDMLINVNDFNPEDLHVEQADQSDQTSTLAALVDLATTENNLMIQGKQVPPTPYSSPAHTRIHVAFTGSPAFQKLTKDDPRVQIFLDHIAGEFMAQQQRTAQGGQGDATTAASGENGGELPPRPQSQPTQMSNGQQGQNQAIPARVNGGGQVPPGI